MIWHAKEITEVYAETQSGDTGLQEPTATALREKIGANELKGAKKRPPWLTFLLQFKDFMILVLVVAAIISGIVGDLVDTIIILIIVFLNALVGFVQEYRAEKTMEALKKMSSPQSTVLRGGQTKVIPSAELVPGDVVLLEAGQIVPADVRITEAYSLRIEESSLTGESSPVDKSTGPIKEDNLPLGDRLNMAYKATKIINGRGRGIVIATGMATEIGKIAQLLQHDVLQTPLQLKMADFGKKLSYIILGICIALFGVGLLRGEEPLTMLLLSVSLAVAAIPEALPALITIALAGGAKRMVKKHVLVRRLHAVETLGSVTYICSDKTGTLTLNKMEVAEVLPAEATSKSMDSKMDMLACGMALNHDVKKDDKGDWLGDPTEVAMTNHIIAEYGEDQLQALATKYPRVGEIPFDSDRKLMTTIHAWEGKYIILVKGAAEIVATKIAAGNSTKKEKEATANLAANGKRVIAYGYKVLDELPAKLEPATIEYGLLYAGLVGLADPARPEAKAAIKECLDAGIQPVMITGDHIETGAAIARELGILQEGHETLTGKELADLTPEQLDERVENIRVYGRVTPEQKLDIVKALQRKNHFVAMTGDGANDAPSLKTANIGIAMGITGTDVSKEAAAMILLDDNFATIVAAIKEGRKIYGNIRKFVKYIMACNSAEILIIFTAPLLGLAMPLLPIHILWINLVTDGLPGLALANEKGEHNSMKIPPRATDESIFADGVGFHIIWVGVLMATVTLGLQAYATHYGNGHWQTEVFTVLLLSQLGHVFAIRSDTEYIFRKGIFTNMPLIGAILLTFLLQMGIIYLPFANKIFKTQPLSIKEMLVCCALSCIVFFAVESEKWIKKHLPKPKRKQAAKK